MNTIEYREKKSDAIIAAIGAAIFHACMISLFILLSILGLLVDFSKSPPEEQKADATVLIGPELFEKVSTPPPPPEPVVKKERKKFIDTNPEAPTTTPPTETIYIGERSTTAASETPLDTGNPNLPTQLTREPEREIPNLYNSNFVDGDIEKTTPAEVASKAQSSTLDGTDRSIAESKKSISQEISEDTETTTVLAQPDELIESINNIETNKKEVQEDLKKTEKEQIANASTLDGESKQTKNLPSTNASNTKASSDPGFRTQKTKTKIIGSLTRDGKSSLNVKSTELGKYYSIISKIIEKEWQKHCLKHQEHIRPGIITMQFFVDKSGKVSRPTPVDVVSASGIQQGFTIQAIRKSKLPPMPSAAQKELGEEKLELIYNFYF